jgi:hypothetical protein
VRIDPDFEEEDEYFSGEFFSDSKEQEIHTIQILRRVGDSVFFF